MNNHYFRKLIAIIICVSGFSFSVKAVFAESVHIKPVVVNTTSTFASVQWNAIHNATQYRVEVFEVKTHKRIKQKVVSTNFVKVNRLKYNTRYRFKITARVENNKKIPDAVGTIGMNTLPDVIGNPEAHASSNNSKSIVKILNFEPTSYIVKDDFENTILGTIYGGSVEYVPGKDGFGFVHKYGVTADGGVQRANVVTYDNHDSQLLNPNGGTIELWVKPTIDLQNDTVTRGLMSAWSGDVYGWNVVVYKNQMMVYRDFGPCARTMNRFMYDFKPDQWYKLTFTWHGEATQFYINNEQQGTFSTAAHEIYYGRGSEKLAIGDDVFVTDNLRITNESPISVTEASTGNTAVLTCPNIAALLINPQETYKNISLHNFPDQATRDVIKSYIDQLPESYNGDIQNIALVDDDRFVSFQDTMVRANFNFFYKGIFLKKSQFDSVDELKLESTLFFHEAAHGHIFSRGLNYGGETGGNTGKMWSQISGIENYAGECNKPKDFTIHAGFLTAYGSTMPDEDLAEWSSIAFDLYNTDARLSALVNPLSSKYDVRNVTKAQFLLDHGFISQTMFDKIIQTTPNIVNYTNFND